MTIDGVVLEARVQRLFFAQGIFAERSLYPAADVRHRLLATDIDVLVSEYASGYHLTRRHAECKSGKRVSILDRILWLNGVRALLGADASYLVLKTFNEDAADFARSLNVDVMTVKQLGVLEAALDINDQHWPSRSDFRLIDPIRDEARNLGKQRDASHADKVLREATRFIEIDSWRLFEYGKLNRLLRILIELSEVSNQLTTRADRLLCARYSASALLVRLSQYLLAMCLDISRVPVSDYHSYLLSRLTYGDQDPNSARGLLNSTVDWVSHALKERGVALPPEADVNRLYRPPHYSKGLTALIQNLLSAPIEARYLPIAVEIEQFGKEEDTNLLPRLRSAWRAGHHLATLVRAFATASLGVNASLLKPLREDSVALVPPRKADQKESATSSPGQAQLLP